MANEQKCDIIPKQFMELEKKKKKKKKKGLYESIISKCEAPMKYNVNQF